MPELVWPSSGPCRWTGCRISRDRSCLLESLPVMSPPPGRRWSGRPHDRETPYEPPRLFDEEVPLDVIYELTTAAEQEEASLVQIVKPEHKMLAAQLSREAEAIQAADPRYQAELEAWTTTDLRRTDGVPIYANPRGDASSEADIPSRELTLREGDGCRR
jgi:hypothetical protein